MWTLRFLSIACVAMLASAAHACELPGLEMSRRGNLQPPVEATMTSGFGPRLDPQSSDRRIHTGQDYAAPLGAPVTTPQAGIVVLAERRDGVGLSLHIHHGRGFETRYQHLSEIKVQVGDCVARGAPVAAVGSTGNSSGPHLHFEILADDKPVDPTPYLDKASLKLPVQKTSAEADASTRGELFDAVVRSIQGKFFDQDRLAATSWNSQAAAMRDAVIAAPTLLEAQRLINDLLAVLKTSHTRLYSPGEIEYHILRDIVPSRDEDPRLSNPVQVAGIGLFTKEIDGRYFADGILEGSAASETGIRFGDEIVSVDGGPYSPVESFSGKEGTTVKLAVRRSADAEPELIDVPVTLVQPGKELTQATAASVRIVERGGKQIGYIHLWGLNDGSGFSAALSLLKQIRSPDDPAQRTMSLTFGKNVLFENRPAATIDALVVDARGKVGGNLGEARRILEQLDAPREAYWGELSMSAAGHHRRNEGLKPGEKIAPPFRGRTALLIDHHTRSAGEMMAYGFQRSKFGPVLGTKTAGAVSAAATFLMPGGLLLYVAVNGLTFDGRPLEGVGVSPEIEIARPLPYANGADPVLDAALDLMTAR
jgi:carboxyl-terminal processing protease